jgi:large exoprotein involved in heme utilization and adhesion
VGLEVLPGNNLAFIGGNIKFDRGNLTARGGNIELGGLSAAGIVATLS